MTTGYTKFLRDYASSNWTGQHSVDSVFNKMKTGLKRKLELIGEVFQPNKHGRYLRWQEDSEYFENLVFKFESLKLTIEGNKILARYTDTIKPFKHLKLKSAYAEDYNRRGGTKWMTGEMMYSTVPVQQPYPFTVDYIL